MPRSTWTTTELALQSHAICVARDKDAWRGGHPTKKSRTETRFFLSVFQNGEITSAAWAGRTTTETDSTRATRRNSGKKERSAMPEWYRETPGARLGTYPGGTCLTFLEGLILLFRDESLLTRFERSSLALGLVIYPLNGYPT